MTVKIFKMKTQLLFRVENENKKVPFFAFIFHKNSVIFLLSNRSRVTPGTSEGFTDLINQFAGKSSPKYMFFGIGCIFSTPTPWRRKFSLIP